ncbi:MAG: hypothetical protein KDE31_38375, partial [Caldilineaceae bacterium]|nr:hypothetical protein [Caldilineaceae bacterium]
MLPHKWYRQVTVIFLVALLAGQAAPLLAQENLPKVFCGELDTEDCLLLQRSRQAMAEVTAVRSSSHTLFQLADMPTLTVNGETVEIPEVAVDLSIDNAYAFDERTAEQWQALAGIDQNVMALAALVAPESILQLFAGLTAETTLQLRFSDAVQTWLSQESGERFPAEINLTMRLVDNQLYIDLNEIAAAIGASDPPAAWGVIDLDELWAVPARDRESPSPAMVIAFMVGALAARNNEQLVTYYEDFQRLRVLDRQRAPGRMVRVERGDDQTINGITVNTYITTVDVRQLATWLAGLLQKLLTQTSDDIDPEVTVALTMGPSFLAGVESTTTLYIEPATARVHRQENALVWDFTPFLSMASLLARQSGEELQVESAAGANPQLSFRT